MPLPLLAAAPALITAAKAGAATGFIAKAGAVATTGGKIAGIVNTVSESVGAIFKGGAKQKRERNIAQTAANLRDAERRAASVEERFVNQTRIRKTGVDPVTGTPVSIVLEPPSSGEVRAAKDRVESLKVRKAMFENSQGPARGSQLVRGLLTGIGGLLQNSGVAKNLGNVATKIFPETPGIIQKAGDAAKKVKEFAIKAIPDSGVAKNIDNIIGQITDLVGDQRSPGEIPSRTTPVRDTTGIRAGQITVSQPRGGGRGGITRNGRTPGTVPDQPPGQTKAQGDMGLIIAVIAAIFLLR